MPERKLRALRINIEALFALFLILIKIAQQPTLYLPELCYFSFDAMNFILFFSLNVLYLKVFKDLGSSDRILFYDL